MHINTLVLTKSSLGRFRNALSENSSNNASCLCMTYGTETWTLTIGVIHKFKVTQRAMDEVKLGVCLKDETKVTDITWLN